MKRLGKTIYISGKIKDLDIEVARDNFLRIENIIEESGNLAMNPMRNNVPVTATYEDHMRADLKILLDCDAIFLMKNWKESKGSILEYEVARKCGLQIISEEIFD
jgi:hypothetical protein